MTKRDQPPSPPAIDNERDFPTRRSVLKGAMIAGTAAAVPTQVGAQTAQAPAKAPLPSMAAAAAEKGGGSGPDHSALHVSNPGSDFMVDVLKSMNIDYIATNPGSSFRGLHESIVTYGNNSTPEMITCTHEESAAAMAHGYAKVAGKPMAVLVHSNVGLQHASMGIFNAWCDRVPMLVLAGNTIDATKRRQGVEWFHTALDLGSMVRSFVKWDDTPVSLPHFAESCARAFTLSMTPPMEPVMIVVDSELQEATANLPQGFKIPRAMTPKPPAAAPESLTEVAKILLAAERPVIVVDRAARTPAGVDLLVKLAEALDAPVVDLLGRMNFPTQHYLNQTWMQPRLIADADAILGLELSDLWGLINAVPDTIHRLSRRVAKEEAKVIHISSSYLYVQSNQQDFERYYAADVPIAADAEACLPGLIEAILRNIDPSRRAQNATRKVENQKQFDASRAATLAAAARGWDASPVSTARLCQEVWAQIRTENWALVSPTFFEARWPHRLWDFDSHYQFIGSEGGYGVGYGGPAAAGAALAHMKQGRFAVNIQTDGDMMTQPGILWTLAHHKIPLLTVMHNNRAWHQETMHVQRMSSRRDRGPERARIGTMLEDPFVDYAAMAKSMGVDAIGPITDPADLEPAIRRGVAAVKSGQPFLIDVVTQPR
jgi:thiamine pyrophosphate-dependent acetolactate synthase large subunit-like protein